MNGEIIATEDETAMDLRFDYLYKGKFIKKYKI